MLQLLCKPAACCIHAINDTDIAIMKIGRLTQGLGMSDEMPVCMN